MRILQVCPHYHPAYRFGGVVVVAHALSKALLNLGETVKVCTTALKDPNTVLDVPLDKAVWIDGAEIYYEPVTLSRYWGFSPALARRVWVESAWADVVLVHFHYQFSSVVGGVVSRVRNRPYVLFAHGSLNKAAMRSRANNRKRLYLAALESGNFRNAMFVAYQSEEERDNSVQFGNAEVVPNGINPSDFLQARERGWYRSGRPELVDKILFLYLGRLHPAKGLDVLLPAFSQLRKSCSNVHLVIAGGDERGYERRVKEMVTRHRLHHHVTLAGPVEGEIKLGLLRDADVFVLPSRSEGMSMAMLEAMYFGLPVIVSDRVGLARNIAARGCGKVVDLERPGLVDAMVELCRSASTRAMAGEAARLLVENSHTWERVATELLSKLQAGVGTLSDQDRRAP